MDLTRGNIGKILYRFALPIILTNLISQAYGLVDTLIVARYAGQYQLSISASANSLILVGQCLVGGAAAAVSIMTARICGEKDYHKLRDAIKTIMTAGSIFAILIAVIYLIGTRFFFALIHLPENMLEDTVRITYIYVLMMVVQLLAASANGILHGAGDSKTPLCIISIFQGVNIVLDLIAVGLMHGGAAGAAWASGISLCLSYIFMQGAVNKMLRQKDEGKGVFDVHLLKRYIHLAIPSILQQSVMAVGSLFLQNIVNMGGMEAINGYTVAVNLNNFLIIPVISYTQAYETFASQCFGAHMRERAGEGYRELLKQGLLICIALSLITIVTARPLVRLYLSDSSSESYVFACRYLWILIFNYYMLLIKYGSDAIFKADLKVSIFTLSSFISLLVRILISYAFVTTYGLEILAWAAIAGNIAAYLFLLIMKFHDSYMSSDFGEIYETK